MTEDKGIHTGSLTRDEEKLLNPPMAGVYAQPLHRSGICDQHLDGSKCPTGGAETSLWRVRWGDGVEMDLCTGCMATLVFEETWESARGPEAAAKAIREMELRFPVEHVIPTTPEALATLAGSLDEFKNIGEELEVLNGSGGRDGFDGKKYSIATDGRYAVLVNAEGYDYPRYRGPRLALRLLGGLTADQAFAVCVRKSAWTAGFSIETPEKLAEVTANPYRHAL